MGLREHWIDAVHRAATGTRRVRTLLTPVGIAVFGGFTALFVVAGIVADSLLKVPDLLPERARLLVAIPTMVVGLGFTAWSGFHFLRAKGTPVPFNPPPRLVTSGPYALSRNPMLTGVFLFLFGLGVAVNSVTLVLVFVPLFVLVNCWELKAIEEPELVKRLGTDYAEYRRRTPMFIPRLSRKGRSNDAAPGSGEVRVARTRGRRHDR